MNEGLRAANWRKIVEVKANFNTAEFCPEVVRQEHEVVVMNADKVAVIVFNDRIAESAIDAFVTMPCIVIEAKGVPAGIVDIGEHMKWTP